MILMDCLLLLLIVGSIGALHDAWFKSSALADIRATLEASDSFVSKALTCKMCMSYWLAVFVGFWLVMPHILFPTSVGILTYTLMLLLSGVFIFNITRQILEN